MMISVRSIEAFPCHRSPRRCLPVQALTVALCGLGLLGALSAMSASTDIPGDLAVLEEWLADREAQVDLVPGTEKQIVWFDGARRQPLSVLYLHGFSASRMETHPLASQVARELGANLYYTRLTGHGHADPTAMASATVEDWLGDGREALGIAQRLGEQIVVIACSTGATVATALAAESSAAAWPVASMVFVSPNFGVANRATAVFRLPLGKSIARLLAGPVIHFEPVNELHGRYWTNDYPTAAVGTMIELVDRAWRGDVSRVDMPVLTLYSPRDTVVSVPRVKRMQARFPNPANRLVAVEDAQDQGQHVIAGDIFSPNTTARFTDIIVGYVRSTPRHSAERVGASAETTAP